MALRLGLEKVAGLDFTPSNINNADLDILQSPQVHKWLGVVWSDGAITSNNETAMQRISVIVRHASREAQVSPVEKLLTVEYWCSVATFVANEVHEEVSEIKLA